MAKKLSENRRSGSSSVSGKSTIFISYSHRDEKWKDRLLGHLRILELEGGCDVWDDRRIGGGAEWRGEIEAAIDRSTIAVLLISSDFLTSNFIGKNEVPDFLQRRDKRALHIYPIIIKPCPYEHVPWLKAMQIRPADAKPLSSKSTHLVDKELVSIVREIAQFLAEKKVAAPSEKVRK